MVTFKRFMEFAWVYMVGIPLMCSAIFNFFNLGTLERILLFIISGVFMIMF